MPRPARSAAARSHSVAIVAVLGLVTIAAAPAQAKSKRCKKSERTVEQGTPVYGGPGLGFEVIRIADKKECLKKLQSTDDGSFVMVLLDKEKAGWVATGLVDEKLNELVATETLPAEGSRVTLRELALHVEPRFDAKAVDGVFPANTELTLVATTPDGQWLKLRKGNVEGWAPKYHVATSAPEKGAPASAGSGAWSVPAAPVPQPERASVAPPATAPAEVASEDGASPADIAESEATIDAAPAGPTHAIAANLAYRFWRQSYVSDAQNDPLYKYDLADPYLAGLAISYRWRPELPVTVDVWGDAYGTGYQVAGANLAPTTTLGAQMSMWARAGWRASRGGLVDVDAGLVAGGDAILALPLEDNAAAMSVLSSANFGIGPTLSAAAQLDAGRLGEVDVTMSLPVGAYTIFPDPGARYTDAATTVEDQRPERFVLIAPDAVPGTAVGDPATAGAMPIHFSVGADGRVRYQYPFSESLKLNVFGGMSVRQAFIAGPGFRNGSYSRASTTDITASCGIGATFGL